MTVDLDPEQVDIWDDGLEDPDEVARWRALSAAQDAREMRDAARVQTEPWPFSWTAPGLGTVWTVDPERLRYF